MTETATLPADTFDTSLVLVVPANPPLRADRSLLAVLPGFNVRVKDESYKERVEDVAKSIESNGFYDHKPFAVVMLPDDPTLYVYDGEHRLDAVDLATLNGVEFATGLPVAFPKEGVTVEDLTVALVHGNNGANLNPVELAAVVSRFLAMGKTKAEIADIIGRSGRHVDNLLVLDSVSDEVKGQVATGQIAAAEVVKIARKTGDKAATTAAVTTAVAGAKAAGKKKATPKTLNKGPKMKTISEEFDYAAGEKAGDFLRLVAGKFREHVEIGEGDKIATGGAVTLRLVIVDKEAEAAKAAKVEAAAAKAAQKKIDDAAKAAKKKATDDAAKAALKAAATAAADKAKATAKATTGTKGKTTTPAKKPSQADLAAAATKLAAKASNKAGGAATKPADENNGL